MAKKRKRCNEQTTFVEKLEDGDKILIKNIPTNVDVAVVTRALAWFIAGALDGHKNNGIKVVDIEASCATLVTMSGEKLACLSVPTAAAVDGKQTCRGDAFIVLCAGTTEKYKATVATLKSYSAENEFCVCTGGIETDDDKENKLTRVTTALEFQHIETVNLQRQEEKQSRLDKKKNDHTILIMGVPTNVPLEIMTAAVARFIANAIGDVQVEEVAKKFASLATTKGRKVGCIRLSPSAGKKSCRGYGNLSLQHPSKEKCQAMVTKLNTYAKNNLFSYPLGIERNDEKSTATTTLVFHHGLEELDRWREEKSRSNQKTREENACFETRKVKVNMEEHRQEEDQKAFRGKIKEEHHLEARNTMQRDKECQEKKEAIPGREEQQQEAQEVKEMPGKNHEIRNELLSLVRSKGRIKPNEVASAVGLLWDEQTQTFSAPIEDMFVLDYTGVE